MVDSISVILTFYFDIFIIICSHSCCFYDNTSYSFFMHVFHLILLILLPVKMNIFSCNSQKHCLSRYNLKGRGRRGGAIALELHLSILFQILLPSWVFGVRKLWQLPFCRNWWAALWITFFWQLCFNTKALNVPGFTSIFISHCLPGRKVFHVNSGHVLCSNAYKMLD